MRVNDLIAVIEAAAPPEFAASWDRCGVQVAARRTEIHKLAVALDPAVDFVDKAMDWGADFLLTHHPLGLKPGLPDQLDAYHHVLGALFRRDAWLYAAHTSLDVQPGGPVRWLAEELGLKELAVLEHTGAMRSRWFRVLGVAPTLSALLRELEQVPGIETFVDAPHSLELVCPAQAVRVVQDLLRRDTDNTLRVISQELDHPVTTVGFGFVGKLPDPLSLEALVTVLENVLDRSVFALAGQNPEVFRSIACCPGSGASMLHQVKRVGADAFITGDLKYHDALTARELGLFVIDVGHFSLEQRMMRHFADQLQARLLSSGVQTTFFPAQDEIAHAVLPKRN